MTQPTVVVISGPNLQMLGHREPEIYGTTTLAEIEAEATAAGVECGVTVVAHQSNHEGEIIDLVAAVRETASAIVINPGALTHYSYAIADALAAFDGPVIEVHLSQPASREPWRHTSVVAPVATATISGLGGHGYAVAVREAARLSAAP